MKKIFIIIGICAVVGILGVLALVTDMVRFGSPKFSHLGEKQNILTSHHSTIHTATLPSFYHQTGQDSHSYQKQQAGVTVTTKLGSNSINQTGYLLVNLATDKDVVLPPRQNKPLNVAIVVDRSGSMAGSKLESVKQALHDVSSLFTERDTVSLVVYDDGVNVLYSENFNREKFDNLVTQISSGGSTNLEGGLKAGLKSVQTGQDGLNYDKGFSQKSETLDHVLLLSDGLANVGLDSPTELASMVEKYQSKGVTVSTVGVGSDYDENIMTAVAKAGRGKYYFMESPTQAEGIFTGELKTLGSIVASDIEVTLDLGPDFEVKRGVGYELASKNSFRPHDLALGKNASYLFEILAKTSKTGGTVLGTVKTTYFNVSTSRKEVIELPVTVTLTTKEVNPLSDNEVYEEFMRSHVAEQMWQVDQDLDQVKNDQARSVLDNALNDLESAAQRMPSVFGAELTKVRSKKTYLEAQGSRDIKQEESGRIFKKSNQFDSFSVQYNR